MLTEKSLNPTTSPNLNPNEVAKFDAMAHHWWDKTGPCAPLHELNPLRVEWIAAHGALEHKTVLDVGCGGGILTESLASLCMQITGIDAAAQAITVAKQHAEAYGLRIEYQTTTAEAFAALRPSHFDVVCCLELIEHVPNPAQLIEAIRTLVKPGGYVFFSTLNRTYKAYLMAILGAEYLLGRLPKGTHDYKAFIKPSELVRMARHASLELETLQGVTYRPLKQDFVLSNDLSVNYMARFRCEK